MSSLLGKHQREALDPKEVLRAEQPKPAPLQPHSAAEAEPVEMGVSISAKATNDARPQIDSMEDLLTVSQEFTQQPLVLHVGERRKAFFVHKHLIPPQVIKSMRSPGLEPVAIIHLANEEPDIVGLMVRWCYRGELPTVTMLPNPSALKHEEDLSSALGMSMPKKDSVENPYCQYQTLRVYFEGYRSGEIQQIVSFEEKRLCEHETNTTALAVPQTAVCDLELNSDIPEIKPSPSAIRTYLRDVEGIPMFGTSNIRVEAELLQLKLVRLSIMAVKYGWVRLLSATLFAYAKGEISLSRRCPILRHIELAYSAPRGLSSLRKFMAAYASATTQAHNTRAELVPLFMKCPEFLHDVMVRQDAPTGSISPLLWHTAQFGADGKKRTLPG